MTKTEIDRFHLNYLRHTVRVYQEIPIFDLIVHRICNKFKIFTYERLFEDPFGAYPLMHILTYNEKIKS